MLIPVKLIKKFLKITPHGVVHVGAHHAEEYLQYTRHGWGPTLWVDAMAENIMRVKEIIQNTDDIAIQALVWSESGKNLGFNVSSNGQSSSLFEFGSHSDYYPEIYFTNKINLVSSRLDEIVPKDFDFELLVLDVQGAELEVLKSLGDLVEKIKYVYTEINQEEVYVGCALVDEIDELLLSFGFERALTSWTENNWGDAFYVKKKLINGKLRVKFNLIQHNLKLLIVISRLWEKFLKSE